MKKWILTAALLATASALGACDDGDSDGAGGEGGTTTGGSTSTGGSATGGSTSSGGSTTTGGAANTGGSNVGGEGGGNDSPLNGFCHEFGEICGFEDENADRYASEAECLDKAGEVQSANVPRFGCMQQHLENVTIYDDLSHCAHAHGASPCSESEFPLD